jgi:translation elongation factor EF-Ts
MDIRERVRMVENLRNQTGYGMMDCKVALERNGYDLDKAKEYLEERLNDPTHRLFTLDWRRRG